MRHSGLNADDRNELATVLLEHIGDLADHPERIPEWIDREKALTQIGIWASYIPTPVRDLRIEPDYDGQGAGLADRETKREARRQAQAKAEQEAAEKEERRVAREKAKAEKEAQARKEAAAAARKAAAAKKQVAKADEHELVAG